MSHVRGGTRVHVPKIVRMGESHGREGCTKFRGCHGTNRVHLLGLGWHETGGPKEPK